MDKFRIERGWRGGLSGLLLVISVGWPAGSGWRPALGQTTSTIDVARMRLTFNEDFNELDVSPWGPNTRWIAHTPWAGDFGDAQFADPENGVFPFTIENGILRIEARKNKDGKWQSGLLASADANGKGFSQQYGYFEMRAKLPPGKGVWPAFWLANIRDPKASTSVELDVMEYYGHNPREYQITTHSWALTPAAKPKHAQRFVDIPANFLTEAFHTYGVLVRPDVTTFYLDRTEVWRTATPPDLNRPLLILVNLALGSGWPIDETPNPSYMYVDYIRAYAEPAAQH